MIEVAGAAAALLSQALPYLLRAGDRVASQASEAIGTHAWEYAQRLWERLGKRLGERPGGEETVADVAADPTDEGARAALEYQLRKVLERDAGLAAEIEALVAEARKHVEIRVVGKRNVVISESEVKDSTIITGNANDVTGG